MDDLSIIIPVRSGDKTYIELVRFLLTLKDQFEIIICGPDFKESSSDDTRLNYIHSAEGRAIQQNNAVLHSTKNNLWFLHADSVIENSATTVIKKSLQNNPDALYFFDLTFEKSSLRLMAINELAVHYRSRILKMPFGDQGFFMSKKCFYKLGFFDSKASYGEDHLLVWKAHQKQIEVLPCDLSITTSSRKYQSNGWFKTTFKHLLLTYKQAAPEFLISLKRKNTKRLDTAVAIFVKTPGFSPVKSRLAKTLGVSVAEEFFRLSVEATKKTVLQSIMESSGNITAYWAVAESECLENALWNDFETISQGEGALGDRLNTVYKKLLEKHESVILIGADLPHLNYERLTEAQVALNSSDHFVMGKTDDGGFYLFGGSKEIPESVWTSVTWSAETTAGELEDKLGNRNFINLEKSFDIDFESDLTRLSHYSHSRLLPSQLAIINWAKNISAPK